MDKPAWAGMALPRCFSHGKQGHRTPGEILITGSVKPLTVPQLVPLRVSWLQAQEFAPISFQSSASCGIQRDPAAASSPHPHGEHERRCESPQLTASVNPQHNTAVPAATTFPRISRSLLPLSRLPSSCLLPDSCVSFGTSYVRHLLQWWHQAQVSESSFTHCRDLKRSPGVPMGPLGDLQLPRMNKIKSRGNTERETTALFFQGPKKAPKNLPCLPDTGSAFLHTKNKQRAGCDQQPAADGAEPLSLDSGKARTDGKGKGTGIQLGCSRKERDPAVRAGRSPGAGGGQHQGHHPGNWGKHP